MKGFFDGASRGNPGLAGCGALLVADGEVIWKTAQPLGIATNNQAEWTALKLLVDEIERRGLRGVEICGDSQLVINQASGAWKINNTELADIARQVMPRLRALEVKLTWVPRAQNAQADALSNEALDGPTEEPLLPAEGKVMKVQGQWVACVQGQYWCLNLEGGKLFPLNNE